MRVYNEEARWQMLRSDMRTYTQFLAGMKKEEPVQAIPDYYSYIGDYCFKNNGKIKEVRLPLFCRVIGKEAFYRCQFRKQVIFPETLVEIKSSAFAGNHQLRQAVFPASLEKIREECYKDCASLTTVSFASGSRCTELPEGIFESCVHLKNLTLPERLQSIGSRAFFKCKELKEVHFPESVTRIGEKAFYFCGMEELKLPGNLQELGEGAFFNCNFLRNITLPTSVKKIGRKAFHGCKRLEFLEIRHDPEEIGPALVNRTCTIRCYKGSKVDSYCDAFELKREYIK